ncbi:MAG: GAF domain-containing protein, partial [Candidatus Binatia bacterium]
ADQAVIAIENVWLFNETREALERQTATAEILKVIASSPTDVQPVLDAVAAKAARLSDATDAIIQLREGDVFRFAAHYGSIPNMPLGATRTISRDLVTGRAFIEGRQIHVHDLQAATEEYPQGSEIAKQFGYRTILVTPLMREGSAIGTIMIRRTEALPFTENHLALVKTFADQAVIAIENVRLFNELRDSLRQQTATADVLKVISRSSFDLQGVLDTLVESATRQCEADHAWLFQREGEFFKWVASFGHGTEVHARIKAYFKDLPVPVDRGSVTGRAALEARVVQVPDVLADSEYTWSAAQRIGGYRSALGVPLLREGVVVGVIFLAKTVPLPFSAKQIAVATTFADQAVIAIENVRLFNETKEALERQTATAAVLRVISSSPNDLAPVFAEILEHATRLCEAELGFVFTSDGQGFDPVAQRGLDAEKYAGWAAAFRPHRIPGPLSGLGRTLSTKAPVVIADIADDEAYRERDPLRVLTVEVIGARTFLTVPLLKESAVIGAVVIYRCEVRPFSEKQVALLQTFADQAVIAIENVRLFRETREALERQTSTAEILKVIASSPSDVQPVFDAIARSAFRLIGGFSTAVARVFGDTLHLVAFSSTAEAGNEALKNAFPMPVSRSKAARTGEPVSVSDTEALPDSASALRSVARTRGFRSILIVPMLREGVATGTISVTRREPGQFTSHEIDLL